MANANVATFVVGFTRNDGDFHHLNVRPGTTVSAVLKAMKYSENELDGIAQSARINGDSLEDILNYEIKKDDVLMVLPAVKGA